MKLVNGICTNCTAAIEVDPSKEAAVCNFCGSAYIVKKAINNYTISNAHIKAGVVNVQSGASADNMMVLAENEFMLGKLKEAEDYCKRALELDPKAYSAWFLLAKISDKFISTGPSAIYVDTGYYTNNSEKISKSLHYYNLAYNNASQEAVTEIRNHIRIQFQLIIKKMLSLCLVKECEALIDGLSKNFQVSIPLDKFLLEANNVELDSITKWLKEPNRTDDYFIMVKESIKHTLENDLFFSLADSKINKARYELLVKLFTYEIEWVPSVDYRTYRYDKKRLREKENNRNKYICDYKEKRKHYVQKIVELDPSYSPPKEGCYIATAVYGSYDAPQVLILRYYRDNVLEKSLLGQAFIRIYYMFSPYLIKALQPNIFLCKAVKIILDRIVSSL